MDLAGQAGDIVGWYSNGNNSSSNLHLKKKAYRKSVFLNALCIGPLDSSTLSQRILVLSHLITNTAAKSYNCENGIAIIDIRIKTGTEEQGC